MVYDKGRLIEGLMRDAVKNGVEVFTGVNVTGIEKTAEGVRVTGNGDTFEGIFIIGADGTDSRVAQLKILYFSSVSRKIASLFLRCLSDTRS